MNINTLFKKTFLLFSVLLILFSCSENTNQRESLEKSLGEPDEIITQSLSTYKSELWVYARTDINRVYNFRRAASGCGGSGEWYIAYQYYADDTYYFGYELYDPTPTITHTPIESSPPNETITISAAVTLSEKAINDTEIREVRLHYRATGDSIFDPYTFVRMSHGGYEEDTYVGEIPAEIVTETGVDYYIKATSDVSSWEKWSYLPEEDDFYSVIVSSDSEEQTEKTGHIDSTCDVPKYISLPKPGALPEGNTSIGP